MLAVVFAAFVCCVQASAFCEGGQTCPIFSDGRVPQPAPNLQNCTQYAGCSCCQKVDVSAAFFELSEMAPIINRYDKNYAGCLQEINNLLCYVCSPYQDRFWRNGQPHVCSGLCRRIYTYCGKQQFGTTGRAFRDLWHSGESFCADMGFVVDKVRSAQQDTPYPGTCHDYKVRNACAHFVCLHFTWFCRRTVRRACDPRLP